MELFQNHCDFPWLMITMMMMMTTMVMIAYEMEILKKRFLLLLE